MGINELNTAVSHERVVRLSLGWILLGVTAFVGISFVGGMFAAWWWQPNRMPLPGTNDRFTTTIQEVTLSPSIATAENVARHQRSVVLLTRAAHPEQILGTGLVITSDGLIASTLAASEAAVMRDESGQDRDLTFVGSDAVFGISYWRAGGGVFVPFEVREADVSVGATLTMLSRNPETSAPRAQLFFAEEYRLPEKHDPAGWQRLLGGRELSEATLQGSPLLDDEGRVAGLVLSRDRGSALPSSLLRLSLDRVASGLLEQNSFSEHGFSVDYVFAAGSSGAQEFQVVVESVRPDSRAAQQGMRAGDIVVSLNGTAPAWDSFLYPLWQSKEGVVLQMRRADVTREVRL